jgi:hypothetical protein
MDIANIINDVANNSMVCKPSDARHKIPRQLALPLQTIGARCARDTEGMSVCTVGPKFDTRLKIHQAFGIVGIALECLRVEVGNLHNTDKHDVPKNEDVRPTIAGYEKQGRDTHVYTLQWMIKASIVCMRSQGSMIDR